MSGALPRCLHGLEIMLGKCRLCWIHNAIIVATFLFCIFIWGLEFRCLWTSMCVLCMVKQVSVSQLVGHIPKVDHGLDTVVCTWSILYRLKEGAKCMMVQVVESASGKCGLLCPVLNVLSLLISAVLVFGNNVSGTNNLSSRPNVSRFKRHCLHFCKKRNHLSAAITLQ